MKNEESQRGSAKTTLVLFLVSAVLLAHAGYNFLPIAYNSEAFKQEMQAAVLQGMSVPPSAGTPVDVTKRRLQTSAKALALPSWTFIEVKQVNGLLQARTIFVQPIPILPFGIYDYQYRFDTTATTNGFFAKQ